MKKNILIAILVLIAASTIVYAFIKSEEANEASLEAQISTEEVVELRAIAVELQKAAEESAAAALEQRSRAEQVLQDCQNK